MAIFTIGEKLKNFRKNNNMTLSEVENMTGLSISFISDIERGRTNPSLSTCQLFCDCYQTSMPVLFSNVRVKKRKNVDGCPPHSTHLLEYNSSLLLCDKCGEFLPVKNYDQ